MRKYDGKEHCYKDVDEDREKSLNIISNLIGFKPILKGLKYNLNFYAGGIGVLDKLGLTCLVSHEQWTYVKSKNKLFTPKEASEHEFWGEDFLWLIDNEENESGIINNSINFINSNKLKFQEKPNNYFFIYFVEWSDVNDWTVFWGKDSTLNYLYYSQG